MLYNHVYIKDKRSNSLDCIPDFYLNIVIVMYICQDAT